MKTEDISFRYKGWFCRIDTILGYIKRQLYCTKGDLSLQRYFNLETPTKEIRNYAKKWIREIE